MPGSPCDRYTRATTLPLPLISFEPQICGFKAGAVRVNLDSNTLPGGLLDCSSAPLAGFLMCCCETTQALVPAALPLASWNTHASGDHAADQSFAATVGICSQKAVPFRGALQKQHRLCRLYSLLPRGCSSCCVTIGYTSEAIPSPGVQHGSKYPLALFYCRPVMLRHFAAFLGVAASKNSAIDGWICMQH